MSLFGANRSPVAGSRETRIGNSISVVSPDSTRFGLLASAPAGVLNRSYASTWKRFSSVTVTSPRSGSTPIAAKAG